ncbi:MAG: ParB/RepB/Spo0J family partition protein [Deltaproteobacteria bacterium]|nr:ParB/RepB/Spo0J family partition protein [Deltaproteobacteria bacterium]
MAANESYVRNHLYFVPLADLQPDPNQPRKYLDSTALAELTASIVQHGVLEPILFRQESGLLYVVAGERRVAAARKAGLVSIPALFIDSQNYAEISLVENLLRSDLTAVEEAEALDRLQKEHAYKQEDLVRMLGKSQPVISSTMSINRLPQAVRDECRKDPSISKRVLIEIAAKKREDSMLAAYVKYKASLNPRKKTQTGVKVSKAQSTFNVMDNAEGKIKTLEIQNLSAEEKRSCPDHGQATGSGRRKSNPTRPGGGTKTESKFGMTPQACQKICSKFK